MPTSKPIEVAVVLTVMLAFSVGVTYLTLLALSRLTGWKKIATTFPGRDPAPNAVKGFGSCGFYALGNYNNCVFWASDDECLHLRLMRPLNHMGHPPISIPWAVVEIINPKARWGGLAQIKVEGIPIRIPAKALAAELELRQALANEPRADQQTPTTPVA